MNSWGWNWQRRGALVREVVELLTLRYVLTTRSLSAAAGLVCPGTDSQGGFSSDELRCSMSTFYFQFWELRDLISLLDLKQLIFLSFFFICSAYHLLASDISIEKPNTHQFAFKQNLLKFSNIFKILSRVFLHFTSPLVSA